ncbi:unnamed protein product [Caretta caretta]
MIVTKDKGSFLCYEQHKREVLGAALNPFGVGREKGTRGLDFSFTSCIYSDHSPSLFSQVELSPASLPVDSQSATCYRGLKLCELKGEEFLHKVPESTGCKLCMAPAATTSLI